MPIHITEQVNQLKKVQRQSAQERGFISSRNVARQYLEMPTEKIKTSSIKTLRKEYEPGINDEEVIDKIVEAIADLKNKVKVPFSFSHKVGPHADLEIGDVVTDEFDLVAHVEQINLREGIATAAQNHLSEREAQVVLMRFGLLDGRERSLAEVGRIFNLSRERVRQIEARALKKLKTVLREFVS